MEGGVLVESGGIVCRMEGWLEARERRGRSFGKGGLGGMMKGCDSIYYSPRVSYIFSSLLLLSLLLLLPSSSSSALWV